MRQFDWHTLADGDRFRSFCSKLLHAELGPGVRPFDAAGTDYAIDAMFEGDAGGQQRKHVFQFKRRDKLSDLKSALKSRDVPRILECLSAGTDRAGRQLWEGVTHYTVMTDLELGPQTLAELQEILSPLPFQTDIQWRELLECRAGRHPYILRLFFGDGDPVLIPARDAREWYVTRPFGRYYDGQVLPYAEAEHSPTARCSQFLESPTHRLLHITGRQGVGKSRLLLQIAEAADTLPDTCVWFLKPSAGSLDGHDSEFLDDGNHIVIVDDAQACVVVRELYHAIRLSSARRDRFKIAIAATPVFQDELARAASEFFEPVETMDLRLDTDDEAASSILHDLHVPKERHREALAVSRSIPQWLVLWADTLSEGPGTTALVTQEAIADRYIDGYLTSAGESRQSVGPHFAALACLAAVQPADLDSENVLEAVALLVDSDAAACELSTQSIAVSGLVATHGRLSGIVPELIADRVLERYIYGPQARPVQDRVRRLMGIAKVNPKPFWRNIARVETRQPAGFLDGLLSDVRSSVRTWDNHDRITSLDVLAGVALYRPRDYLQICQEALRSPQPDSQRTHEFWGTPRTVTSTHAHVLEKIVEHLPSCRYRLDALPDLLETIAEVGDALPEGRPGMAQRPEEILRQTVEHSLNKPMAFHGAALDVASRWTAMPETAPGRQLRIRLSLVVASALLVPEFHHTTFQRSNMAVSWRPYTISPTQGMVEIWTRATELLSLLSRSADVDLAVKAVEALGNSLMAAVRARSASAQGAPELDEAWAREEDRRFDAIAELGDGDHQLAVALAIDRAVAPWLERGASQRRAQARGILDSLEASAEYALYRELMGGRLRWDGSGNPPDTVALLLNVAQYPTDAGALLARLLGEMPPGWAYGSVADLLLRLGETKPDYAVAFYSGEAGYPERRPLLRPYLGYLLQGLRSQRIDFVLTNIRTLATSHSREDWVTAATAIPRSRTDQGDVTPLTEGDAEVLQQLAHKSDLEVDGAVLRCLPALVPDREPVYEDLMGTLAARLQDLDAEAFLEAVCLRAPRTIPTERLGFVEAMLDHFIGTPNLDQLGQMGGWLLGSIAAAVAQLDLLWLVGFFEARMATAAQTEGFSPIPFRLREYFEHVDRASPAYVDALRRVRNWTMNREWHLFEIPVFFQQLAGPEQLDGPAGQVLREWISAQAEGKLWRAAFLLREFHLDDTFAGLAAAMIDAAASLSLDGRTRVEREVSCSIGTTGAFRQSPGEPLPPARTEIEVLGRLRERTQSPYVRDFCDRRVSDAEAAIQDDQLDQEERRNW
jgi:hypothetical protein